VVTAFRLLEAEGWLEARPQSGFFVNVSGVASSPSQSGGETSAPCTVRVSDLVIRLYQATQRENLVSLGAAVPKPALLPLKDLREAMARAMRRSPDAGSRYSFPPGEVALRVQIARRAVEAGCAFSPDDIQVTSGCQEAINLALRGHPGGRYCRHRIPGILLTRTFPHATQISSPTGGYLLWLQLPEDCDAMRLQQSALAAGISISPGSLFSPNAKYSNCIRLSVALPWDAQVEDAIKRLGKLATDQMIAAASHSRQ